MQVTLWDTACVKPDNKNGIWATDANTSMAEEPWINALSALPGAQESLSSSRTTMYMAMQYDEQQYLGHNN